MHACQLNDIRVDKRGIRGVCTPANLYIDVRVDKRGVRGVCTPANLMTFVLDSWCMHGCRLNDVRFPAACDSCSLHGCQLNDVCVDKRGIRAVCTAANLMTFVSTSVGFVEYARLPTYILTFVSTSVGFVVYAAVSSEKTTARPDLRSGVRPAPAAPQNKLNPIQNPLYEERVPVLNLHRI